MRHLWLLVAVSGCELVIPSYQVGVGETADDAGATTDSAHGGGDAPSGGGDTQPAGDTQTEGDTSGLSTNCDDPQCAANIALDNTNVYWTNATILGNQTVLKMPLAGGTPTRLAASESALDIVVDSTSVYWTDPVGGRVLKVPIAGGTVTTLATKQPTPASIAVDGTSVYWTNNNPGDSVAGYGSAAVAKVPLDGGTVTTLVMGANGNEALGIARDANNVYWTDYDTGSVCSVPIGGGTVTTLYSNDPDNIHPVGIAVDATSVYWTDPAGRVVLKIPIGGGTVTTLATGVDAQVATGIAVDSTRVYWSNDLDVALSLTGNVMAVLISGGTPTTIQSGLVYPEGIAVNGGNVFWASSSGATVGHAPK